MKVFISADLKGAYGAVVFTFNDLLTAFEA